MTIIPSSLEIKKQIVEVINREGIDIRRLCKGICSVVLFQKYLKQTRVNGISEKIVVDLASRLGLNIRVTIVIQDINYDYLRKEEEKHTEKRKPTVYRQLDQTINRISGGRLKV